MAPQLYTQYREPVLPAKKKAVPKKQSVQLHGTNDFLCDSVSENQRGTMRGRRPVFSSRFLMPTDWPGFSQDGKLSLELSLLQCGVGWEYVSDWIVDMNGPVNANGWMYAPNFASVFKSTWALGDHVRTRKWIRMRRVVSSPVHHVFGDDVQALLVALRSQNSDRERVEVLRKWVDCGNVVAVSTVRGS